MGNIIVTITDRARSFTCDLEMPTNVKMEILKGYIAEALNGYKPNLSLNEAGIELYCSRKGQQLKNEETLESAGVWNGDYIVLFEG